MLRTAILATVLLVAIALMIKTAIAPVALQQDGKPSTADITHPPTVYGASAVIAAPKESRR